MLSMSLKRRANHAGSGSASMVQALGWQGTPIALANVDERAEADVGARAIVVCAHHSEHRLRVCAHALPWEKEGQLSEAQAPRVGPRLLLEVPVSVPRTRTVL